MREQIHSLVMNYPYWMALAALVLGFITDAVWIKWTAASNALKPIYAANWSGLIYVFGVSYTLIVVESSLLQITAYVIGGWLGTYYTVLRHRQAVV